MRLRFLVALIVLTLPSAWATWQSSPLAPAEPSTIRDDVDGFMFHDPPSGPVDHIHLDLLYTPISPLGETPHHEALLGAWRDCNSDGLIGSASGDDYSTIFLLDPSICPPGSRHNDGVTVREFLAIGPGALYPDIDDPAAAVWVDALLIMEDPPALKQSADDPLTFDPIARRWSSAGLWLTQPAHATAYANVGIATIGLGIALAHPQNAVYGADGCPNGVPWGNWDCNPANWPMAPRAGDVYQLRDTDCALGQAC